jgi:enediyne biosynthesis protein E4
VLLHRAGTPERSLRARLVGTKANRDAAGARVALVRAGKPPVWRRVGADGSYLSSSELTVTFGLGDDPVFEGLGVVWPGGRREFFADIESGRTARLVEGDGAAWPER